MTSGQVIAAELRLGIVSGEIESHIQLSENQVAQQFNVSRSPVRDAFKLLQTDQLIQLERMALRYFLLVIKRKRKCMICV